MSDADSAILSSAFADTTPAPSLSDGSDGSVIASAFGPTKADEPTGWFGRILGKPDGWSPKDHDWKHSYLEQYLPKPHKAIPNDPSEGGGELHVGFGDSTFNTHIPLNQSAYRFLAGVGGGMTNAARGVGQMFGAVDRDDIAQARALDAPLMDTRAGKLGNIVGMGAAYAPLAFVPGVNSGAGAAAMGAGIGFAQPSTSSTETAFNTLTGGVLPSALNRAGRAVGQGWNGVRTVLDQESAAGAPWATSNQSMGAASASGASVSSASPDLQAAYREATLNGKKVNNEVLNRHLEADSLPQPVRLTEGQATEDPAIISTEMNRRGATGLDKFHNAQDAQLKSNLQILRDQVGPDVFSTNPVEHGDTLVNGVADNITQKILPEINGKFDNLRNVVEAHGNEFPIDGQRFVASIEKDLGPIKMPTLQNEGRSLNQALDVLRSGEPISAGDMLHLRDLASNYAASGDGKMAAIGKMVLNKIDNAPLRSDASNDIRAAWTDAIGAARREFQMQDNFPWYKQVRKGISNDPVSGIQVNRDYLDSIRDGFARSHVINAPQSGVASLRSFLDGNERAQQTMSVAALDDLRTAAGIDAQGNNPFNQARFNKRLEGLRPKLGTLFPGPEGQHIATLGNVARYVKQQPAGNYVNNSGTLTGALAEGAKNGLIDAAAAVTAKPTAGLSYPLGQWFKQKLTGNSAAAELQHTTRPLAGAFED